MMLIGTVPSLSHPWMTTGTEGTKTESYDDHEWSEPVMQLEVPALKQGLYMYS